MALVVRRSDKFPVGTTVKAFAGAPGNRHHEGRPSGTAAAEATVAGDGSLTFSTLAAGLFSLWAEVAGTNANLMAGSEGFTAPGTLRQRIAAKRLAVGA